MTKKRRHAPSVFAASLLVFALLATTAWFKEHGVRDVLELDDAIVTIDREIAMLKIENMRLIGRLERINENEAYVEMMARSHLGLVKPGETVFEFMTPEDIYPRKSVESEKDSRS